MSVKEKCPLSVPLPFTTTVNTSGSVPAPVNVIHSLSASHSGFTRISEFTFTTVTTGSTISDSLTGVVNLIDPPISTSIAVWDFGDGYTLSAANTPTTTHTYKVPGIYTVGVYFYDIDGNTYLNTFTSTVSVYNYVETNIQISNTELDSISGAFFEAGSITDPGQHFSTAVSASWQDTIDTDEYTLFVTASGSKSKPYDTKSKYAHLIPYNAFYEIEHETSKQNLITPTGLTINLQQRNYTVDPTNGKIKPVIPSAVSTLSAEGFDVYVLGSFNGTLTGVDTTTSTGGLTGAVKQPVDYENPQILYYDDTPNTDPGVQLIVKLDTSKHRLKNFYVDDISFDINGSGQSYLETGGAASKNYTGILVKVIRPVPDLSDLFSFTSTGMKEMSGINYKRQGDKFQVFVGLQDKNKNILKNYPQFLRTSNNELTSISADYTFHATWVSGSDTHTSNISSISTNKFPYNTTTGNTELSSYLYLNVDPLSSGTWSLNISANIPTLESSTALSGHGNVGANIGESTEHYTGSYTFTVYPSTNDTVFYLQNEDIDYSEVIKGYRFQSFMHEYDNLFDGIFTSFVGEASSSPTTFGKTVFSKIANFVNNHNDVDLCKVDQLQSFYDLMNEDIDIILPQPPSELKRLYDTFSIKLSKLLGNYVQQSEELNSNFYTSSAAGRNVDYDNPITSSTYTVTAYTNFVARQRFNNEFIIVKPQKIASTNVYAVDPVLLIRGNVGSGASFLDSSTSTTTHTITANRNATHSTTQSKFTGGSIKIDGDSGGTNADYLCAGPHDDFVFRTDDFTIDCWMYVESFDDYEAVFSQGCKTNNNMLHALEVTADGAIRWLIRATYHELVASTGSETIDMRTPNGTISTDTWHHIAAVRSGAYFYIFIDGVLQAKSDEDAQPWPINKGTNQGGYTTRSSTGNYWYNPLSGTADLIALTNASGVEFPVYIGARVRNPSSNIDSMHGYIDEFRITRTAIWTSDFTPPTSRGGATADSSYPLSAYNVYSTWGWPLDTSVSGASGLSTFYDFYPYTTYDSTSADKNLENNIIDYNNTYTTISRSASSLSGNWNNDDGIIYKNLDFQIRKGLNI